MAAPRLAEDRISQRARDVMARLHPDVVDEVARVVARDPLVIVGMAQNPHVKRARKLLDDARLPYTYLEYGSYLSGWRRRLAIKLWAHFPTFPMVFVKGTLIGGASELEQLKAEGGLEA